MKALFRLAPILAALTSPALAGDGLVAQRPEFQVGDRFTYADRFETVACKDWKVEQVDEAGNLLMVRCGDNVATLAPDGGILRITGKDGKTLVSFSPRAAAIPFPLQIGQHWTARFEVSVAGQIAAPTIDETCEVTSVESVTIQNAALPAFRIACTDRWHVAFLSGSSGSTLWYAPDARSVVKAVNEGDADWNLDMTGFSFH